MSIVEDLASPSLEARIRAMSAAAAAPAEWAAHVVATIEAFPSESYFTFERIRAFGGFAVAPLRELLQRATSAEVRECCQVCLGALGSGDASALLELVSARSDWQYTACRILAVDRPPGIEGALLAELEETPNSEDERAATLYQALLDLKADVPAALRARLATSTSFSIRGVLRQK